MECLFVYITLFLLSWCHPLSWALDDRLISGDTLSINQTLISTDRTFALGFFSPGNSTTTKFYLGIWYNIPDKTIVWVANRESPLTDSPGVLKFSNDSNLIIMDSKGRALWTSDVSGAVSYGGTSAAVLLNSGNLVIRHDGDTELWQSFDQPTDTLLPGMKLQFYSNKRILSWRSALDPSAGRFSLGEDPSTHQQFIIWQGKEPYLRGSVLTGDKFMGREWNNVSYIMEAFLKPNGDPLYVMLSASDGSPSIRYTLLPNGHVVLFILDKSSKKWVTFGETPNSKCETYGLCGPNGYCDMGDAKCKCLEGFEPKVWRDWSNGNFSGGCTRQKALNCDSGDDFSKFTQMKLPDKFLLLHNLSIRECEAKCSGNCSCTAYASYVSGQTNNISRCLIWTGDLIDLSQFDDDYMGADLYMRLVPLERDGKG